jgi:hypothetical protein
MTRVSFSAGAADPAQIGRDDPLTPGAAANPAETVVSLARSAAVEEAGGEASVGQYLGAVVEDAVTVSAAFASRDRGYRGWYWSVTVALVDPSAPTVSEVVLLPGEDALLAPAWVPWERRIRPGDLGPADLLPPPADDIRLVPGYVLSDDPAVAEVAFEIGFGRERVLSREGRDDAAERWHEGSFGPDDPVALAAPATCVSCAFYVPLAGLLGQAFGACANEFSPADGRVVDGGYGCGAHSETVIEAPLISASTDTVVDELVLEVHPRPGVRTRSAADPEPDADPDLLADVVTDQVLDELIDAVPEDAVPEDAAPEDAAPEDAVPEDDQPMVELDVAWDLEPADEHRPTS